MTQRHSLIRDLEFSDKYFADLDFINSLRDLNKKLYEYDYSSDNESNASDSDTTRPFQSNRLPKRNLHETIDEIEYICLDSDEDEQGNYKHVLKRKF